MKPSPSPLARDVRPASPVIVELAGTPGSGKTTALAYVHRALRQEGWASFDPETDARKMAGRTWVGRVVQLLPAHRLREALLWRTYLAHRLLGAGREVLGRPGHFAWLWRQQRRRPEPARVRRRRVLHWYLRMVGAQRFYRSHLRANEAVVFDEGYLHRVVQLFSSPVDRGSASDVERYVEASPPPDLLVHVEASRHDCLARVELRGVWPRLSDLDRSGLASFLANAEQALRIAVDHARAAGRNVTSVDNSANTSSLQDAVIAAMRGSLDHRQVRGPALSSPVMPGPRQLAVLVSGRLARPKIPARTVDRFLEALGTERTGRISNLPLGRRSASVRVRTGLGPLVVRAYPDHWPDESLEHEHALLQHLEAVGFPATRLVVSPNGNTVQHCEGRRLAAYRFVTGRNLGGSFLGQRMAEGSHVLAGRLLADLHRATSGLSLPHRHHLAMIDTGDRLSSLLALLDELSSSPSPERDLAARAEEVAERLGRLHSTLTEAAPSIAVIHGDYGLHNLLVHPGGSAIVVDFELARRDWCLVDLVEALGPMSRREGDAFLEGYADAAGGEPAEWKLLATMWEYHRLGGALRAWQSYVKRADPARLVVARRRLAEADRVSEKGIPA